MSFVVPVVMDNTEGWGPVGQPDNLFDAPFAPFSKSDKLGKAADWLQTNRPYKHQYYNQGKGANSAFDYKQDDDEESFRLVENKTTKPTTFKKRTPWQPRAPQRGPRRDMQQGGPSATQRKGKKSTPPKRTTFQKWGYGNQNWHDRNQQQKETRRVPSVNVGADWEIMSEFEFSRLKNLTHPAPAGKTLVQCGFVEPFDMDLCRLTPNSDRPLERVDRPGFNVTTSDDPIIRDLAKEDKGNVFATDTILAVLMCATRSNLPWDIVVTKIGTKLLFDKRDNSPIDFVSVDETATELPGDEPRDANTTNNLSQEATSINHLFSQQALKKSGARRSFDHPHPFASSPDAKVAAVGYAYRTWELDEIKLVARCELDGYLADKAESYVAVNALNEYNPGRPKGDWRKTLEGQGGAVLATELKNNGNKLSRWTAEALLAGVDQMAIGFVSRAQPRDMWNHRILGVQMYQLKEFTQTTNLNPANLWGILREIITRCSELPNGKYLLLRDPNLPKLQLYKVPGEAFDEVQK